MPKLKLIIAVIVFIGVVIIGEAIYAFTRPDGIQTSEGLVLIGIAVVAFMIVTAVLVYIWRSLKSVERKNDKIVH